MIDALISSKLIKSPELKTGQSGKYYCQFLLSVAIGEDKLKEVAKLIGDVFKLMPSEKHMVGRDLGRLEPTESLRYRAAG